MKVEVVGGGAEESDVSGNQEEKYGPGKILSSWGGPRTRHRKPLPVTIAVPAPSDPVHMCVLSPGAHLGQGGKRVAELLYKGIRELRDRLWKLPVSFFVWYVDNSIGFNVEEFWTQVSGIGQNLLRAAEPHLADFGLEARGDELYGTGFGRIVIMCWCPCCLLSERSDSRAELLLDQS